MFGEPPEGLLQVILQAECWCRHVGVARCSQAAARVQRQQIFRSFEEIPSSVSDTVVLKTLLPHCVAAGSSASTSAKGYLNAVQYALTRQPMTKEVYLLSMDTACVILDCCVCLTCIDRIICTSNIAEITFVINVAQASRRAPS